MGDSGVSWMRISPVLIPSLFLDGKIRVFCKSTAQYETIEAAFRSWTKKQTSVLEPLVSFSQESDLDSN